MLSRATFQWRLAGQTVFQTIKEIITAEPVLCHLRGDQETHLQTDASGTGLSAVLVQTLDGRERVVAYASRRLTQAEIRRVARRNLTKL